MIGHPKIVFVCLACSAATLAHRCASKLRPAWPPQLEALLTQLSNDPAENVRAAAKDAFLHELLTMDGFERSCLVVDWATSTDPRQRLMMAQVLAVPVVAVGVDSALSHLATDTDSNVRETALASTQALTSARANRR